MGKLQLFVCIYLSALVTSQAINVKCQENYDFPPTSDRSPSLLADLKLDLVKVSGKDMMNVSWAIDIDASIKYLIGTRIIGKAVHLCEYVPPLAESNLTGIRQLWFHYLVKESYGSLILVSNLPLPPLGSDLSYKLAKIVKKSTRPTQSKSRTEAEAEAEAEADSLSNRSGRYVVITILTTAINECEIRFVPAKITDITTANPITDPKDAFNRILVKVYLGLAAAMILTSGYIIYKRCGTNSSSSAGLKSLATSAEVPVRVLLVYPPENGAFQKATMALAEFLQSHAGCSVAIDVWQQNRIAHVGPMRWLAEQVEAARRVLVVCPPSCHPPPITVSASTGGTNIPAAAHDLYPLILNMVASHAKSARELAKFWVLQLGEQQDKRCNNLAPELRACELFCLMKDLSKLCHTLHTHEQNAKTRSTPVFGPGIIDDRTSVLKLRDSVEKLSGCCLLISREAAAVNSVIISV
ncbi:interleukin-17 receptor B isoform X2 [Phycodurus eques]|uniref:interleukin-17 receptor B isoform X2 n=1 Tax=Phycodurus eques TaxID=693459 RepID=UPI002ACDD44D|nr:interleukin-17 receptor B isoform X2 [Phycodurus eques]